MPEPFGYSLYAQLMKLKWGEDAAVLGAEAYGSNPLDAFAVALGLKEGPATALFKEKGKATKAFNYLNERYGK